jgi:YidC/Oxa1 family membrane protein insertase
MQAITGFFATIIGYPVQWIYSVINNYGITIIIVTFIVRLCLIPLYAKQMKNSAKMAGLQSKQKEIQARYANDRTKMNEEMQALYQKEGISTMSGCLPLLIQLPIIWGLFALLRNPLQYMTSTNMIAAVHESFLWVTDLSQPDSWILPIIAGVTTYFTSVLGMSTSASGASQPNGMMNSMKYFMPIMIFLMGRSFPAGLALYWAIGNCVTIAQSWFFNKRNAKKKAQEEAEAEVLKRMKKENAR